MPDQPVNSPMAEKIIEWIGGLLEKGLATGTAAEAYDTIKNRKAEMEQLLQDETPGQQKSNDFYMRDVTME